MADVKKVKTPVLRLAYEESGPANGERVLLLHGWPDSPRTWDKVLPRLHAAGYQTVTPYLRGYGPSRFRSRLLGSNPRRTGQEVAYAQDMIDLADRLGMKRFHFVGHDWGARAGYVLAALWPKRVKSLVAISVPFTPPSPVPPSYAQAQAFWYQWLLCSKPGELMFRADPVAYGRAQWDAWSPAGWYTEAEFAETAKSWKGEAFKEVVLQAYRSRWGHAALDPRYARQEARFAKASKISVPTVLVHGEADRCELTKTTEGAEKFFSKGLYTRSLLAGVGHFPQREDPDRMGWEIMHHLTHWMGGAPAR